LSLDDRAVIFLTDQLGISEQDTVPNPFVPFFIAMGDAWFPNERDVEEILDNIHAEGTLTVDDSSALVSYLKNSHIQARNEQRVREVLAESPIADAIDPSELNIKELPPIPDGLASSEPDDSTTNERDVDSSKDDEAQQDSDDDLISETDSSPTDPQASLTDIPGVGAVYAETLRNEGYTTISNVAETPATELATETSLTVETTQCIRLGAKELRGDSGTPLETVAEETSTPQSVVSDAYVTIASCPGDVQSKIDALHTLFSEDESVLDLENHSLYHLYLLYHAGFEDLYSVADASLDELTAVPYITHQAKDIRGTAREAIGFTDEPSDSSEESTDELSHTCPDCGKEFKYERVLAKHRYSCDGTTQTDDSDDSSKESADKPPYTCPDCGNEYTYERVLAKHRYSCDGTSGTDANVDNQTRSTDEDELSPCALTEYYESLRSIRTVLKRLYPKVTSDDYEDPLVQYYTILNSVINNQYLDQDVATGYGPQHVDRVSHAVGEYRDTYGNGDWITEYQTITTVPPSESVQKQLSTDLSDHDVHVVRPVVPTTNTPLPVVVDSKQELRNALGVLAQFPAEPSTTTANTRIETQYPVKKTYQALAKKKDIEPVAVPESTHRSHSTDPDSRSATERPIDTGDCSPTRLIAFGHVSGNDDIVEKIAAETRGSEVDAYIYTGSQQVMLDSPTSDHTDTTIEALADLAEQAPVYIVDASSESVWNDDTDTYAPPSPPTPNRSAELPDNVEYIPIDERVVVGDSYLTQNPWLNGSDTVLVSHQARPEQWHGRHVAYIAGEHFVGRQDRTYLNVGFASFDPGVGRDTLHGQYVSLVVNSDGLEETTWETLGTINEHTCSDHEDRGRLYLLEGLNCPFCAIEDREQNDGERVTETPTTVYERPYLIASDNLPARRAYQIAYFDQYSITHPDELSAESFPPTTDATQADFDAQAVAQGDVRGELMYFLDTETANEIWLAVQDLVAQGALYDARISTAFTCTARGDSQHLLMVAIPNYADIEDAHRVHRLLTEELSVDDPTVVKPTLYTNLGIYTSNASDWGLTRSTRYTVHADEPPSTGRGLPTELSIDAGQYPNDMARYDQWLLWKPEDDGRKIPRAPWETGDDRFVSAMEPDNQTSFETAIENLESLSDPKYGLAFTLTADDPFVLIDYDDARDPDTGEVAPMVRQHIEDAESYADISTSGTGVHLLVRGVLSEDVQAVIADLPDHDLSIEVYDQDRFIVMTGDHLSATPPRTTDAQGLLDRLQSEHATRTTRSDQDRSSRPEKSRSELSAIDETTDIEDVFDSINQTRPSDIRLRSTVTNERADGSKSLDPSWTTSDSGTRLGQLDDIWIYRKGMYVLNALQVVALEERLISHPDEYPSGETFWNAVAALRDRGAHIPNYVTSEESKRSEET
jgi:predicted flap endonuclease-1-like 5' DNA nuclease/ssDNA-binding Zn-finger/Zn-ribbon topoisomerase 1